MEGVLRLGSPICALDEKNKEVKFKKEVWINFIIRK